MLFILPIVIALAWWALQLMEQAYQRQEFSRMLAGLLVAFATGGVVTTYFLMTNSLTFTQTPDLASGLSGLPLDPFIWTD